MPFPITCNAVGDIVTIVQLALGIYQALNDSRGSSADFQDVSSEIRRLSRDLSQVQSVIQHADVPKDFADTISKDIASCQAIIDDFQERIAPFGRALGPRSVPRGWALRAARKLDWRLRRKDEAIEFRKTLDRYRLTVATHLISLVLVTVQQGQDETREGRDEAREERAAVQAKLNEVWVFLQNITPAVGFSSQNGIMFTDVLGRRMVLPMMLCMEWQQFDATVKVMFGSGCNGHELMGSSYVARGAYEVTRTLPNGREETITPHKWATAVKIGSELAMGIIIEQKVPIADRGKKICPRCHEDNSNSADDSVLWYVTLKQNRCDGAAEERHLDCRDDHLPHVEANSAETAFFLKIRVLSPPQTVPNAPLPQGHYSRLISSKDTINSATATLVDIPFMGVLAG
ncbi:hypothetical protein IEO21_09811 [Rhodonia placenta]|uniref:Ubiquitin-like domain-containing protein n=1 Tax=Rhodonia placenta TaxID=104341 RepID=A0A8H7NTQ4_9APHY|nr:hypothetical protein IEO21_09811 [Postia placenta]